MTDKHLSETRTEDTVVDLLKIQGWKTDRAPKGSVVRQNEYKNHPALRDALAGKSKRGKGDGYPDFLLVDAGSAPLMVIETKASKAALDTALDEAIWYAKALHLTGHRVIAVGVAGQEQSDLGLKVAKNVGGSWTTINYHKKPISWIPTPVDVKKLLGTEALVDLSPVVPSLEVLAEKADLINRILREASVKDEYRPAYVGAIMLALWQSHGNIRKHPDFVLHDVNNACRQAFAKAGKSSLGDSLLLPESNSKLSNTAWEILATLEKLNVVTAVFDHDYLGQLYETFFRYTGGNTIGQYFTPRQVTRFMADLCQVGKNDLVIDPACGTGGFLISVIQRAFAVGGARYEDVIEMVRNNLIGYESEPITAALCVANMILRGDGKSGISNADVFVADDYPIGKCNVALMNPPFPHKSTDVPPQQFVDRALQALQQRGTLAVVLPASMVVKKNFSVWRSKILKENTLRAVVSLPDETFQPYASATTCILVIEKGVPHDPKTSTSFVRVHFDGLTLSKGVRIPRKDGKNQIPAAVNAVLNQEAIPGFAGKARIYNSPEWSPGAYIPSGGADDEEILSAIDDLMRRHASFYTRYAPQIVRQRSLIEAKELSPKPYRKMLSGKRLKNASTLPKRLGTIGAWFEIFYGQKELHSRDGIPAGDSLIISPTEQYNGTYGWLTFSNLINAPFVTVAQTGSIGEAFVQTEPCGVNDDCLILLPRERIDMSIAKLFIAAAVIRLERWRFSYGRKLTPSRIAEYELGNSIKLEDWVTERYKHWSDIVEAALREYMP